MAYLQLLGSTFIGYANYLFGEVLNPHWGNFFYWLIGLSAAVYALELLFPWRKEQPIVRQDFWLDTFYMFFNVFLFSLVGFAAISDVVAKVFNDLLANLFGIKNTVAISVAAWPYWAQLLTLFVVRDFIQWNIHRLLHYSPRLWTFHKVHHSVQQMGFAAHLRYHFVENIVYRTLEYLPLAMIGYGINDFIIVYLFTLAIGHLNHANIYLPLGALKYLLNSPQMHIWHHAKSLPNGSFGVNYGITLSIWDYLFGTVWMPHNGRDIELGFQEVEQYPNTFVEQMKAPFSEIKK